MYNAFDRYLPLVEAGLSEDKKEELSMIRDLVREFTAREIRPHGAEWDRKQDTPWPIIAKAHETGIYSYEFFLELFMNPMFGAWTITEMFGGDAGIGLSLLGSGLAVSGIVANGTPEQITEWAPKCFEIDGKPALGAFCVSEPEAGSDVSSLKTRAVRDKKRGGWVLNGTKTWITNGGIANVHVVVASVDPKLGVRGQASFIVPPGTEGLSEGGKFSKHGIRASHTAEVVLDDVFVPDSCLLGGVEKLEKRLAKARSGQSAGGQAAMATFDLTRPMVAAQAIGVAGAAYAYAAQYATERKQFGDVLIKKQLIAAKLAEMKTRIDAAAGLVFLALHAVPRSGKPPVGEGSESKYYAAETAVWVTDQAMQILGGAGYVDDHPVAQWHRDAKIFAIYEGTSEIQQLIVASAIASDLMGETVRVR